MYPRNCLVLFREGARVTMCGKMADWFFNEKLAESLWGRDTEDGKTWGVLYFLPKIIALRNIEAADVNKLLGRKENDNWQGFTVLDTPAVKDIVALINSRKPESGWPAY